MTDRRDRRDRQTWQTDVKNKVKNKMQNKMQNKNNINKEETDPIQFKSFILMKGETECLGGSTYKNENWKKPHVEVESHLFE